MDQLIYFSLGLNTLAGVFVLLFALSENRRRAALVAQNQALAHDLKEADVLRATLDALDESRDERVLADALCQAAHELLSAPVASYAILERDFVYYQLHSFETVPREFQTAARDLTLSALYDLEESSREKEIHEDDSESFSTLQIDILPRSHVSIPLLINNTVWGVLTLTSPIPDFYETRDMSAFYRIVHDAEAMVAQGEGEALEKEQEEKRNTFMHMVVHELRAPLTSIRLSAELLQKGKLDRAAREKMLVQIERAATLMLRDVNDLLDASKIESGKFEITKSLSDIGKTIAERIEFFRPMADDKHIALSSHFDFTMPLFEFDQVRIGQVLNNLLSNAIKFTPIGGKINVTVKKDADFVEIAVRDTGSGIDPQKSALLFTRYGQIENGLHEPLGTGLGLFIAKGIVSAHDGKIWIDSAPGLGATVTFTLPLVGKEVHHELSQNHPVLPYKPPAVLN